MKTYLVVNPRSANGQTGKRWAEIGARLGGILPGFKHAFTSSPMHATQLTREALHEGFECIVAVGGDGTINEVANGFFHQGSAINGAAALAVIPRGTGGDFRRSFDWDLTIESAVQRLKTETTQPLDIGLLEYTDHQGKPARRYFANICSFGASGLVDKTVNEGSKALGGKLSFLVGSLRALAKYSDKRVRVSFDGGATEELDVTTLAVANGKYFGGGMKVAPEANPSDGFFDITVWTGYSLSDMVLKSSGIYSGAHVNWKGTRTLRCKTLEAQSDEEVLLDVDGEQPGRLPCKMTLLPGAIRVKV